MQRPNLHQKPERIQWEQSIVSETGTILSKNRSADNFKRFVRNNNNVVQGASPFRLKSDQAHRGLYQHPQSPDHLTNLCGRKRVDSQYANVKTNQVPSPLLPKSPTSKKNSGEPYQTLKNQRNNRVSEQLQNSKRLYNTNSMNTVYNNNEALNPEKGFFKNMSHSSKFTIATQKDYHSNTAETQLMRLREENFALRQTVCKMTEQLPAIQRDNQTYRKSNDQKLQKMKKEVNSMHNALMQEQTSSLACQKKLKETTQQMQILYKERNLILGQLSRISRAKIPKELIQLQSFKEVSLQLQLSEVKNMLNESKTQTQKSLQEQLGNAELLVRKLQEDISKYEIANRVLLKKVEDYQKFREGHKNCSIQFKKLKQKYSQLLTQYHELKKSNLNLLKENVVKNKLLGITGGGTLASNINAVINSVNAMSSPYSKSSVEYNSSNKFVQKRPIEEIGELRMSKTHTAKESEISMEFSIDFDTQPNDSTIFK